MYKCSKCHIQSKDGETQFKLITKKRMLTNGWEIAKEINVCFNCYNEFNDNEVDN